VHIAAPTLRANLGWGAAYVLAAWTGSLLTHSPGNISPVWPASGIALGALLLHGRPAIPGVLLGIFLVKFHTLFDGTGTGTPGAAALAVLGGTAGPFLQAWVGAELIDRHVGRRDPLIENGRIAQFLLLAGPASCLIGATLGTATLYLSGLIGRNELPLTWAGWWGGDAIGAITFTPIVLILFARPRAAWQWRVKTVVYPLLAVVAAVIFLFHSGYRQVWQGLTAEFARQVNLLHLTLDNRIQAVVDQNRALKAFYDGTELVSEHEFEIFASTLLQRSTGINALEWIPRIARGERTAFETHWLGERSIREGDGSGGMVRARERDEHFPIRYLVPREGNESARGYDVASNAGALESIGEARDSGQIAATPPIRLIQDPDRLPGTVLYSPIYEKGDWHTVEDRRAHFLGIVASVFRVTDRIAEVRDPGVELQLDVLVQDGDTIMYGSRYETKASRSLFLERRADIRVANRTWSVTYRPSETFFEQHFLSNLWWLLLGSFSFTGFAGAGLLMLTGQTLKTERLVTQRTRELINEAAERKRMMEMRELQNQVLAQIAGQETLENVLESLVRMTEAAHPGLICSIHILNKEKKRFSLTVAPSMPPEYGETVGRYDIGPGVGSCGTSASTGERVIVEDVYTHPYWSGLTGLARQAGIRACWSEPILSDKEILGSFAFYHREARQPGATDLEFIRDLAALASIAIVRRRSETQIERLAFYDVLTDLPNRRLLLDRLEREMASAARHGSYGALLYIDLDNFKTLNDSMGHFVGDLLLIQVADRLRDCIRREDTAARLGGDEFVIVLREEDPNMEKLSDKVMVLARRIQTALTRPYDLNGYLHHISPSIGITFFSREVGSADEVLKQADTAMYSAKAIGRNTISFYHPDMQKHVDERLMLERELRGALSLGQFRLVFQPQYDQDMRIIGAEALIRWEHPERGVIPPNAFIPVAEENRMIGPIGDWVIEQACRRLEQWPGLDHMAVNISPVQLQDAGFLPAVHRLLDAHPGARGRLMLEMTESIMIGDVEATAATLRQLRERGVGISIDDFGKGYSSLAYLKILPLSQLKIDRAFVNDISLDASGNVIVGTIIAMARHLKLSVIAEGVETRQQLTFLQEQGCQGFQGYYFSKPLGAEAFGELLNRAALATTA